MINGPKRVKRPRDDEYFKVREAQFRRWYNKMRDVGADWSRPEACAWQAWLSAWDMASYLLCPICDGTGEVDSGAPDPQGHFINVVCPGCEDGLLVPFYEEDLITEADTDNGMATGLLRDLLDWLDIEIASHEQWIDHLRIQNRPQETQPYEGERAGMVNVRDWLLHHGLAG